MASNTSIPPVCCVCLFYSADPRESLLIYVPATIHKLHLPIEVMEVKARNEIERKGNPGSSSTENLCSPIRFIIFVFFYLDLELIILATKN